MTMEGYFFVALCICAGAGAGWLVVPWAADALLRRAYHRACSWWWDSYHAYLAFKRDNPHAKISSSMRGEEGALGMWVEDATCAARAGSLARERVQALEHAGFTVDASRAARCEADQQRRCSFSARIGQHVLCATAGAVMGGGLALLRLPLLPSCALAFCELAMTVAIVCDLRARILPLECCVAIAVAGGAFQMLVAGVSGLVTGAIFGLVVSVGCMVANHLFGRRGALPVGFGDVRCMAALSLASGATAPMGLAVCYVGAALFALAGLVSRKLSLRDGIPMAPFLAAWLLCAMGVLACG